jgi:hypothetical protein
MRFSRCHVARLAVLLTVAFLTGSVPHHTAPAAPSISPDGICSFRPEVRLRKLHLVRPDLIPYPLAYEIYC